MRGRHLAAGALHRVGDADCGVDQREEAEGGEDLVVGVGGGVKDGWGDAVQGEREVAAAVAEESPCDPPQAGAECEASQGEGQEHEIADGGDLMPELPDGGRGWGICARVEVHGKGEWQAGGAVGQGFRHAGCRSW